MLHQSGGGWLWKDSRVMETELETLIRRCRDHEVQ